MSRMRYIAATMDQPIRFVGLSTALANAADLADWLGIGAKVSPKRQLGRNLKRQRAFLQMLSKKGSSSGAPPPKDLAMSAHSDKILGLQAWL